MGMAIGGRLVARALARHGVSHVFTLCGGHIQAIYDGCLDEGIRVVDTRHEQTAGHAADGWARVTGTPGVCLVTAGPGVTDVVTALANALRAAVPMVCIGGAGPVSLADKGSLQDMDSVTLVRSVTKWAARVTETDRLGEYVDTAFRIAQAGVPGPTYLEMPLDVLLGLGSDDEPLTAPIVPPPRPGPDEAAVAELARLVRSAERPALLVGSELRWSSRSQSLRELADGVGMPTYVNGMARGALPVGHHALFAGSRRKALATADLVVVVGTPFDFRLDYGRPDTFARDGRLVQVSLDPAELGRNRRVDLAIQADAGLALAALATALGAGRAMRSARAGDSAENGELTARWAPWLAELRAAEADKRARIEAEIEQSGDPPSPLRVCREIARRLGPADVVVGDGGDFVATAASVIPIGWPQLWMDPGPFGTLGVGPGYAMAAKLARPDSRVVIVYGDGSFGLHGLELEAMVRQEIPVVAVIGNDAAWSQIRRGQIAAYGAERAVATTLAFTRYDEVVRAVGGVGFWVERQAELGPALDAAFASGRPACVNVRIGPSEFRQHALSV